MGGKSKMRIQKATKEDAPAINDLVNLCYRAEESLNGWTSEAKIIRGNRTDSSRIEKEILTPGTAFLKGVNDEGQIIACVYLEQKNSLASNKMYVGMLCVRPELQGSGLGRQMMDAAVDYARSCNCTAMVMYVITIRDSLIAWYERLGFIKTGEKEPFPDATANVGVPIDNAPLEFYVLEKPL